MNAFWSTLKTHLASLPANLQHGLRPGSFSENSSPALPMRKNFFFHLHPVFVNKETLKPTTTLGLGLITLALFFLLIGSGLLLMIYYLPSPRGAYDSIQDLQYAVTFGAFVRALHRWAAHAMVLTAFLHMLRVSFTGAYFQRELNWTIGLVLLLLTLGLAFTGYLLPWDQLAYWAVSVSANLLDHVPWVGGAFKRLLLGGKQIGPAALIRFYMLHVALLPILMFCLVGLHLWRIRKDGGLVRTTRFQGNSSALPAWPHLLLREAILVMALVAAMCLWAAFVTAPLEGAPDIHVPSNPEKTPWYFLWLQEMVSYSAPVGGFVFPGFLLLSLCLLPFIEREAPGAGRWFGLPQKRFPLAVAIVAAWIFFIFFQWMFMGHATIAWLVAKPAWVGDLLNPASGMMFLALIGFIVCGIRTGSTRTACFAALMILLVAVIGFTFMGWCRGPVWTFYWPWEEWPLAFR